MTYFSAGADLQTLDLIALAILLEVGDEFVDRNEFAATQTHTAREVAFGIHDRRESGQIYSRCVAVAAAGGTLYVAANGLWVSKEAKKLGQRFLKEKQIDSIVNKNVGRSLNLSDTEQGVSDFQDMMGRSLKSQYGFTNVVFVVELHSYLATYHAEMQLVNYFIMNRIVPNPARVGVSKPCCPECQAVLTSVGLAFTEGHDMGVKGDKTAMQQNAEYVTRNGVQHLHPIFQVDGVAWLKSKTGGVG